MKRLLIAVLAIMLVASLFTVAAAEDKLSLSGSMRVRAWDTENYDGWDDNNAAQERSFWDQRLRIGGALKANDAVSAHFRLDFSESQWGSDTWAGSRYGSSDSSPVQVDRAYLQIVQDLYTLKAGQLYFATGQKNIVYDNNTTGITATIKTPVIVDLHYSKLDENGGLSDDSGLDTEDMDAYVLQGTFKADAFSVGGFYAAIEDSSDLDDSIASFGVFGSFALGPVNLLAEIDSFDGDAPTGEDYMGTQLYVNAEWKMDKLILGGDVYYAEAAGSNEIQVDSLGSWYGGDFGDFQPVTYSAFEADYNPTRGKVFDFTGDSAGVVGFSIYAKFVPMEKVTLWGQVAYLEPDDEDNTLVDDNTVLNLSASWEFVPNTTIAGLYSVTMPSVESGSEDDAQMLAARLQIKF